MTAEKKREMVLITREHVAPEDVVEIGGTTFRLRELTCVGCGRHSPKEERVVYAKTKRGWFCPDCFPKEPK